MLDKILKDKVYLSMILGALVALISFICCIFIDSRVAFTVIFIINICTNFLVSAVVLLSNKNSTICFRWCVLYLLVTLFILLMDVLLISNIWDMNVYSNLMYVKNIELYLGMYSVYVLVMVLMGIYVILKSFLENKKDNIRQ